MLCSGTVLACGIIFSRLALAETHAKRMDHHTKRLLPVDLNVELTDKGSYYQDTYSSATTTSYSTATSDSYSASTTTTSGAAVTTTAPAPTAPATAAVTTITLALPTSPTCDATQPKFAINNLLVLQNGQLKDLSTKVQELTIKVIETNSQEMAGSIAAQLNSTVTSFKTCMTSIQVCGIDPKPLSANKGISLSDVSWSAFQIILTLKTIFESVSSLYKPFPNVQKTCSSILLSLSTSLASLIGACSEQLNLFDTRFFPLVTPQLKEFMQVDDNFSAFFGSFIPT